MKILNRFKKIKCANCKESFKRSELINYAGFHICSADCMVDFFKDLSIEKLLELEEKDKVVNKDFHTWLNGCRRC